LNSLFLIILNWNGKSDTIECLSSLALQSDLSFELVVVDNGSTDGSKESILRLFPHIHWIQNNKNEGFARGNNIGIDYALKNGATGVFLLNNDTTVDKNCICELKKTIHLNPQTLIGCQVINYYDRQILDHLGGQWNSQKGVFDLVGLKAPTSSFSSHSTLCDYVSGCSLFIPKEVIEKIGYLDERFFLIWEEADFCMRAKNHGFKAIAFSNLKIYHKVSQSFKSKKHHHYFYSRNRLLFIRKHTNPKDRFTIWMTLLIPEWLKLIKLYLLRNLHQLFAKEERRGKILGKLDEYEATLMGFHDYFKERFGPAPHSIFKKRN